MGGHPPAHRLAGHHHARAAPSKAAAPATTASWNAASRTGARSGSFRPAAGREIEREHVETAGRQQRGEPCMNGECCPAPAPWATTNTPAGVVAREFARQRPGVRGGRDDKR
jgi:hypothetical protein